MSLGPSIWMNTGRFFCDYEAPKPPIQAVLEDSHLFITAFNLTDPKLLNTALKLQIILLRIFRGLAKELVVYKRQNQVYFLDDNDLDISKETNQASKVSYEVFNAFFKDFLRELKSLNCESARSRKRLSLKTNVKGPPIKQDVTVYSLTTPHQKFITG